MVVHMILESMVQHYVIILVHTINFMQVQQIHLVLMVQEI